ncbi:MAG: DNA alkylation repair protein [Candidatus Diapherotrites archaeon]|nr:DNA alkylation repair protein [Candidatus Diapherotrites archaeon]
MSIHSVKQELKFLSKPAKAKILQHFFKTGRGEYGEGDIFIGVTVPQTRAIAKKHASAPIIELEELLESKVHEERLAALLILVEKFKKAGEKEKKEILEYYLQNTKFVNNWDLVDLTADKIVGEYLLEKNKRILHKFARSNSLWKKRIAIIATFAFIKKNSFEETFKIAEQLLEDRNDLIHKAVGWMLREIGKRNLEAEEAFLKKHYKKMPRTMLRYSIEKFSEKKRQAYLKANF